MIVARSIARNARLAPFRLPGTSCGSPRCVLSAVASLRSVCVGVPSAPPTPGNADSVTTSSRDAPSKFPYSLLHSRAHRWSRLVTPAPGLPATTITLGRPSLTHRTIVCSCLDRLK